MIIAAAIDSVNKEFEIAEKFNCTITDNRSNSHCFYAAQAQRRTRQKTHNWDYDHQEDVDEKIDFVYIDIGDIFLKYPKECETQEATASDSSDEENIAAIHTKRIKLPKHVMLLSST